MENICRKAQHFFRNASFDWAVCGGSAIDLFVGKHTRPHQDVDIAAFWEDRDHIIIFMLDAGWRVFEACGGGRIHELFDVQNNEPIRRNLFCFPSNNSLCQLAPVGGDEYRFKLGFTEQIDFNYVEFLFNERDNDFVYYSQHSSIMREISKAIHSVNGLPVIAPEIALLYKSMYFSDQHSNECGADDSNRRHNHDFSIVLPVMSIDKKSGCGKHSE